MATAKMASIERFLSRFDADLLNLYALRNV